MAELRKSKLMGQICCTFFGNRVIGTYSVVMLILLIYGRLCNLKMCINFELDFSWSMTSYLNCTYVCACWYICNHAYWEDQWVTEWNHLIIATVIVNSRSMLVITWDCCMAASTVAFILGSSKYQTTQLVPVV